MSPTPIEPPTGDFEAYAYEGGALRLLARGGDRDVVTRELARLGPRRVGALAQGGKLLRGHNAHDKNVLALLDCALAALREGAATAPESPVAAAQPEPPPAAPSPAPAQRRRAAPVGRCAHCDEPAPLHLLLCPVSAAPPPPRPEDDPRRWPAPAAPAVEQREEPAPPPAPAPASKPARVAPPSEPRPPCEAKGCDEPAGAVTDRTRPETAGLCRRDRQRAYERAEAWGVSLEDAARSVREGTGRPEHAPPPAAEPRPTCEAAGCDAERGRIQRNTNPVLAGFCNGCRQVANDRSRYLVGGVAAVAAMLREGTLRAGGPPPADALCGKCGVRPRGSLTVNTPPGTEAWCGPCRRDAGMKARGTTTRPRHTMKGLRRGQRPTEMTRADGAPEEGTTMTTTGTTTGTTGETCTAKGCEQPRGEKRANTNPLLADLCQGHRRVAHDRTRGTAKLRDVVALIVAGTLPPPDPARQAGARKSVAARAARKAAKGRRPQARKAARPAPAASKARAAAGPAGTLAAALETARAHAEVVTRLGGLAAARDVAALVEEHGGAGAVREALAGLAALAGVCG